MPRNSDVLLVALQTIKKMTSVTTGDMRALHIRQVAEEAVRIYQGKSNA